MVSRLCLNRGLVAYGDWEPYKQKMGPRFGAPIHDDPLSDMWSLRQTGTLEEYIDAPTSQISTPLFPKRMTPNASSSKCTSDNLSINNLTASKSAPLYARLLPTCSTPTPFETSKLYIPSPKYLKSMTNKTLNEKRGKGVCFWCDEKFIPGQKCKKRQKRQIFMLQL